MPDGFQRRTQSVCNAKVGEKKVVMENWRGISQTRVSLSDNKVSERPDRPWLMDGNNEREAFYFLFSFSLWPSFSAVLGPRAGDIREDNETNGYN